MSGSQPVWTARTGTGSAADFQAYSESVHVDEALVQADLAGSVAHVLGLHAAGLLEVSEAVQLVEGLQTLADEAADGDLELDPALEDVHMNVEAALEAKLGDLAGKLHTARSRNDQVALDLTLVTRAGLVETAQAAAALASALSQAAREHVQTPWPLHTHGLPAQPATLGYLLHAHALQIADDAGRALALADELDESPLGAGAGAGSTLPIEPAIPAQLMGLAPPSNGLLATGAREGSLAATQLAARIGHHVEALAVDLLELSNAGAIELPGAYTTGSSIMPHKRNPDALELARADGGHLATLRDDVEATTAGLGLGYQRDLQRAKPPLIEALETTPQLLGIVANVVHGLTVDEEILAELQASPGVATTDAVEALVAQGVAFRDAHQLLAQACQAAEQGGSLQASLEASHLEPDVVEAALDALDPDPSERSTAGGPAPETVLAGLDDLDTELDELADEIDQAAQLVAQPFQLLETPAKQLVSEAPEVVP